MADQTSAVGMERKLAAIFSTDVAGYSRLMGEDEEATIHTLTAYRALISSLIQQHRGRVIDSPGDNLLAEFASVVDAVRCAVEIQHELQVSNAALPDHRQMHFRIGINLGDVIVEGERLYGDGVNIAARMESLAEPGGICISGTVHDHVKNKLALSYEDLGPQQVKNIAEPVCLFRVVTDEAGSQQAADSAKQKAKGKASKPVLPAPVPQAQVSGVEGAKVEGKAGLARRKWTLTAMTGLLLIAATIVAIRHLSSPIPSTQPPPLSPQATPAALPLPDKPSIIVLPFVNMSNDPEQDYFSDGITEDIASDLSKISSLFVIARNSAFTYKGKAVKVQDISREMGVRYVLEGSVRKADNQVRITAQLIDATTGHHVWAERYDRPLKDVFALQDEIVQKIVTTLKLQLTLQEQGWIVRKHTDNLEAYDAFLRGVESYLRLTKEFNSQARQLFEKALALDPQYAEAYAWLGMTYWREWVVRWNMDPQTLERALALAQQAVALDDSLPRAHSALSYIYAQKQQYEQAIAEGERAIALDPNNADSYARLAEVLNMAGRPEEGQRSMGQAMRLNPYFPPWYFGTLGWAYSLTGRYTESIAMLKEAISRSPNDPVPYSVLVFSYALQWISQLSPSPQTLEEAVAMGQRALTLSDSWHRIYNGLGYIYLFQQQYEQALAEIERAVSLAPNEAGNYAALAMALSEIGKTTEALQAAAQALRLKPAVPDLHLADVGVAYVVAGHYEEARAPLQRFLSHYPNHPLPHLMLAAVYSELGQAAEAQKEAAEVLRLNPHFSLEVHKQRMPIKDPAVLERHIAALRKAGLK